MASTATTTTTTTTTAMHAPDGSGGHLNLGGPDDVLPPPPSSTSVDERDEEEHQLLLSSSEEEQQTSSSSLPQHHLDNNHHVDDNDDDQQQDENLEYFLKHFRDEEENDPNSQLVTSGMPLSSAEIMINVNNDHDDNGGDNAKHANDAKAEEEAEATHYFNDDPTPLHNNRGFFKEEEDELKPSNSLQIEQQPPPPPLDDESQLGQNQQQQQQKPTDNHPILESQSSQIVVEAEPVDEPDDDDDPQAQNQSLKHEQEQQPQQQAISESPRIRQKRRTNATTHTAIIEGDASTAFSHYRPVLPLSCLSENYNNSMGGIGGIGIGGGINETIQKTNKKKRSKFMKKKRRRRDKRDHKRDGNNNNNNNGEESEGGGASASSSSLTMGNGHTATLQTSAQHTTSSTDHQTLPPLHSTTTTTNINNDPIQSILLQRTTTNNHNNNQNKIDPILQNYLPQLTFLNEHYYSKVKPYRMGKRNLPLNQLEVILRRRAVRKRIVGVVDAVVSNGGVSGGGAAIIAAPVPLSRASTAPATAAPSITSRHHHHRPPLVHQNSPPRRKLFPQQQQQQQQYSPTPSHHRKSISGSNSSHYEDDSTISSTTIASQLTSSVHQHQHQQQQQQHSLEHVLPPQQQQQQSITGNTTSTTNTNNTAIAISEIPQEEIVGDTSLGLKLAILQGKVIIQHITPLDDGRASPAQLCNGGTRGQLLSIGDVIIAVNGKSLINGTIHNPVGMDRILHLLRPLSQPIVNEETKEYSREVRLRVVIGEGLSLLQAQAERQRIKLEDRERRIKLGLDHGGRRSVSDGGGGLVRDPAADLFGIGAFMAVDQHSGMPMFGHMSPPQHHHHHEKEEEEEKKKDGLEKELVENNGMEVMQKPIPSPLTDRASRHHRHHHRHRSTIQAQIAHQIQLDREYTRHRNTSAFFTLNKNAPLLLRPPSPPTQPPEIIHNNNNNNPIDARKKRLERGAKTVHDAKSLVSIVESYDRGIDPFAVDEDPMEVASKACGTAASIRTGASRRRWHRGDNSSVIGGGGIIAEDPSIAARSGASNSTTTEQHNLNFDISTIRSGESGVDEACDHRKLVELAANNNSWKMNVLKRLEAYAQETERESKSSLLLRGGSSSGSSEDEPPVAGAAAAAAAMASFDSFLFGGDVANILGKKKQSLALPPGEMTSMLYDLVELLEGGLPDQIFMKDEAPHAILPLPFNLDKNVSFANRGNDNNNNNSEKNSDVTKATNFLLHEALGIWLKSFRPLPWKQRRALWPTSQQYYGGDGADNSTFVSSRMMDDNESLSMMSGTTAAAAQQKDKRNLRELIEDMELDHETRRETCRLVTFYFTQRFSTSSSSGNGRLSQEEEEEVAALIDAYGSYLDIYKCLICAGKLHSKLLVDKLVCVAKYDSQHKEAVKALQKAKVLLFYEPNMLSALLELLPLISSKQYSSNLDFVALLVSAYPDLQPWCVHGASDSEHSREFYFEYLSSLLHHEDGNDAAKRDEALVKEWCLMLCSPDDADPAVSETYRQSFFHIASRDDQSSLLYHRDLPFLMDISVKMSEFGLTLSLAKEIVSNKRFYHDEQVLPDVLQHLCIITDKAIEGNDGEINTVLLGQVIAFFNVISPCLEEPNCEFNNVAELSKLLGKCYIVNKNNPHYSRSNIDACITTISENAPPAHSLQVFSQWEYTSVGSSSLVSALHTSLIRGAREGFRNELSGSLLRIQRAREEGRRPIVENGMMRWNTDTEELDGGEEEEAGGFIWNGILDGTLEIDK